MTPTDKDVARAIDEIEGRSKTAPEVGDTKHPAGPHAAESLTQPDATPGAGALPTPSKDIDGGVG